MMVKDSNDSKVKLFVVFFKCLCTKKCKVKSAVSYLSLPATVRAICIICSPLEKFNYYRNINILTIFTLQGKTDKTTHLVHVYHRLSLQNQADPSLLR